MEYFHIFGIYTSKQMTLKNLNREIQAWAMAGMMDTGHTEREGGDAPAQPLAIRKVPKGPRIRHIKHGKQLSLFES